MEPRDNAAGQAASAGRKPAGFQPAGFRPGGRPPSPPPPALGVTARQALAAAKARLSASGADAPSLDAELFLAEALGAERSSPAVAAGGSDQRLGRAQLAAFARMVRRRQAGECAAYVLGRKEFYGLEFLAGPGALVPRPDTETLAEAALELLSEPGRPSKAAPPLMLELCTGSGAVAIAAKSQMPEAEVWASDISPEALEIAKANARRLLPPGSVSFRLGSLFGALGPGDPRRFHLIAANPPYVPSGEIPGLSREVRAEPRIALDGGADGLCILRAIASGAMGFLFPGGALLLEADPRQMPEIALMLKAAGFCRVRARKDLSGRERAIEGRRPA